MAVKNTMTSRIVLYINYICVKVATVILTILFASLVQMSIRQRANTFLILIWNRC